VEELVAVCQQPDFILTLSQMIHEGSEKDTYSTLEWSEGQDENCLTKATAGKEKTHIRLPRATKFYSPASKNTSSVAQWASEISLSSLVSLNENVTLINDNFQSEAISKLTTARLVNH